MFNNRDFYKQLHETPPYVSAHKVFHKGKVKPRSLKVHEDSDPLLPKVEKEKLSKNTSLHSQKQNLKQTTATTLSSRSSGSGSRSWYRKWKLKDLSLFRSASEGHARRDNYVIVRKTQETLDSSSSSRSWYHKWKLKDLSLFRSALEGHARRDNYVIIRKSHESLSSGLANWSNARRKDGISPHERHYINNRAATEEMRRKTFLPYKKTLMGCSDLDPGVREFCKGACS